MMRTPIDDYLASVPDDKRALLAQLRTQIRAAASAATETISYGMPAFRLGERYFLGLGTTKTHCSFTSGARRCRPAPRNWPDIGPGRERSTSPLNVRSQTSS